MQRQYCLDLLDEVGLLGCKSTSTPLDLAVSLHQDHSERILILLGTSVLLVNAPSQTLHMSFNNSANSTIHHFTTLRVVRYLKNCPSKGLFYSHSSTLQFFGFSDADWAGCPDTRHSTSGYCFYIGESPHELELQKAIYSCLIFV